MLRNTWNACQENKNKLAHEQKERFKKLEKSTLSLIRRPVVLQSKQVDEAFRTQQKLEQELKRFLKNIKAQQKEVEEKTASIVKLTNSFKELGEIKEWLTELETRMNLLNRNSNPNAK